ncbi:hypothetical protein CRUP_021876 [Coryphaenoides rupestris]|nr:hypothetical protein CRUP_021876 [Coryphaenoides rupestris]
MRSWVASIRKRSRAENAQQVKPLSSPSPSWKTDMGLNLERERERRRDARRDVKLWGACRRCLGSGQRCGVNREKGGQVVTGLGHRACCSRRYSVMMLSSAGGDGRTHLDEAPWSDFCLRTRGFLTEHRLDDEDEGRSREKRIRPIRAAETGVTGVDQTPIPLARRPGVLARRAVAAAGVAAGVAAGRSASRTSALAVSWRPLASRWFRISMSSSFSGKVMRDCATTLALCRRASDTSVPIRGLPEIRSVSSAAYRQKRTISELLERQTEEYHKADPDPFDDRHPGRADPDSMLGHILKMLFRNDDFTNALLNGYVMTSRELSLNTAACRLLQNIMPGLESAVVFQEKEGLVEKLFSWAREAESPLCVYATGLLARAMANQEIAANYREENALLVPLMIQRLREFRSQEVGSGHPSPPKEASSSSCPVTQEQQQQQEEDEGEEEEEEEEEETPSKRLFLLGSAQKTAGGVSGGAGGGGGAVPVRLLPDPVFQASPEPGLREAGGRTAGAAGGGGVKRKAGREGGRKAKQKLNFRSSSSPSGAEQRRDPGGQPANSGSWAEQSSMYLASLLLHKKFAAEFIGHGGVQRLLEVPRPSMASTGVSLCLYYLAYNQDAMERVCALDDGVLAAVVRYALWLLESSHASGCCHATMFFSISFSFRSVLLLFDRQDGLRRLVNLTAKHTCMALRRYFEAHLAVKTEQVKQRSEGGAVVPKQPHYKDVAHLLRRARPAGSRLVEMMEYLVECAPPHLHWDAVETFLKLSCIPLMLQLISAACDWRTYYGRSDTVRFALDILAIVHRAPQGMSIILGVAEGEVFVNDAEIQKSALQTRALLQLLGSGQQQPPIPSNRVLTRMWQVVQNNNGIKVLLALLSVKMPITDADLIRSMACKALVGLSRCSAIRQIISKLPLFSSGHIQQKGCKLRLGIHGYGPAPRHIPGG